MKSFDIVFKILNKTSSLGKYTGSFKIRGINTLIFFDMMRQVTSEFKFRLRFISIEMVSIKFNYSLNIINVLIFGI